MKKCFVSLLVALPLLSMAPSPALSYPSTSPSAQAAARLKFHPPLGWIRHYLGDDRYKIKGGTWKVVSTESDRYYYPAWAPEMLRQSPGIVIGFASARDAEEAGYLRSNYPMELPTLDIDRSAPTPARAPSGVGGLGTFSLPKDGLVATVNRGGARRIVLSDGVSSAILPKGWTHMKESRKVQAGARNAEAKIDIFAPGNTNIDDLRKGKGRFIVFGSFQTPGINAEALFSPKGMRQIESMMNRSGRVNSGMGRSPFSGARAASFGNIRGITMPVPVPELGTIAMKFGGRGSKMFLTADLTRGMPGASTITNSFRGR